MGEPYDGLDGELETTLRSARRSTSIGLWGKQNREFIQQRELSRRAPQTTHRPQRRRFATKPSPGRSSHSRAKSRGRGNRQSVRIPFARSPHEAIGASQVDHEPLRLSAAQSSSGVSCRPGSLHQRANQRCAHSASRGENRPLFMASSNRICRYCCSSSPIVSCSPSVRLIVVGRFSKPRSRASRYISCSCRHSSELRFLYRRKRSRNSKFRW